MKSSKMPMTRRKGEEKPENGEHTKFVRVARKPSCVRRLKLCSGFCLWKPMATLGTTAFEMYSKKAFYSNSQQWPRTDIRMATKDQIQNMTSEKEQCFLIAERFQLQFWEDQLPACIHFFHCLNCSDGRLMTNNVGCGHSTV